MEENEKLNRMNNGVVCTKEDLLSVLDDMRGEIEAGDSFEGFFNYLIPDDNHTCNLPCRHFKLMARYRIGNLEGQGGMRFFLGEEA